MVTMSCEGLSVLCPVWSIVCLYNISKLSVEFLLTLNLSWQICCVALIKLPYCDQRNVTKYLLTLMQDFCIHVYILNSSLNRLST